MHTITVLEDTSAETLLGFIEKEISQYQTKYSLLSFQDQVTDYARKILVEEIKKHFDIFVVLQSDIPRHKQRIEEYFSYGVHGLYFNPSISSYSKKQVEIMTFATDLFALGWVFAASLNDKSIIEDLLSLKIIPIPAEDDDSLIDFIKSHKYFGKISPNLKSIPLLDRKRADYSLADKIKMKMLLETMNFRQKLMVKRIDESFGSSGL